MDNDHEHRAQPHPLAPVAADDREPWQQHAACRGSAIEQFFEHRTVGGRPHAAVYRVAERFCAGCPVVTACRSAAESTEAVGLWGGQWRPTMGGRLSEPVDLLCASSGAGAG